jgi:diguanylate cyclase (GGDEF)-like protein
MAITAFVVFVCVALLGVNVWLALQARDEAIRQATLADMNLTRAIAQQMNSLFSETARILDTVAFELGRVDGDPIAVQHMHPMLVNYAAATEQIHSLFVMDAQGQRIVSSESTGNALANDSQRAYFTYHRDSLSLARHLGKPYLSRIGNVWLIPVSRRLNDLDGHFTGVVLATVKVAHIQQLMADYEIGQYGALSLSLSEGGLLTRRPFTESDMDKTVAGTAQFLLLQKHRSGTIEFVSPLDGVERVVSYQYLKNNPLFVTVALSKQELLQPWRTTTYVQTVWIVLLCSFVGLLGNKVVRLMRDRLRDENMLRKARNELTVTNAQLTHLAHHDGLTGLANRRYFDETLMQDFANARRTGRPMALIMVDVDHFKLYNDIYGHPAGDRCLQAVACSIASAVRQPHDFVARYGGEEIAVLLPETDTAGAVVVAEAICLTVANLQLPFVSSVLGYVSISAGVAAQVFPGPNAGADELLGAADRALYRAKRGGRNRVVTEFDPAVSAAL